MKNQIIIWPLILCALLAFCGCRSTWKFKKTSDGRTIAVLNNFDEALPPFGRDWSAIIQAATKNNTVNGQLNLNNSTHELYQTMDQDNAQMRNFLVAGYAWYVNMEMDTNAATREKGRELWITTLDHVFTTTTSSRNIQALHGAGILQMKNTLQNLFDDISALEFTNDPQRAIWLPHLKDDTQQLEDVERGLPENQRSDVGVIARSILEYENGDYGYAISRLPQLHIQMPMSYYLLAAAYARAGETNRAEAAAQTLLSLGEWAANPHWQAKALMLKGGISISENNATNAFDFSKAAIKQDADFWPAYYNLAAAYTMRETTNTLSGQELTNCIALVRQFQDKANWSAKAVVSEIANDDDHPFDNLISTLNNQSTNQWQTKLISNLETTNWPSFSP